MYYNSTTGQLTSSAPWGNHHISDSLKVENYPDWQIVDDSYIPPAKAVPTVDKITELDNEYQPQFTALAQSLGLATLDNNQTVIDSIKADYAALKTTYADKRQAIENG